ncbi:hypothetical protein LR48_Vigan03g013400 [Vigna angularis]|uniref:Uncharacterized protein n=1 Tax=Phaseolus angularis TaxID=3914 RepID=A0A0L9U1Q5_PHAAN|nr:hypothetical protein LR48_Vigan03g013400 [Vigna angularis]
METKSENRIRKSLQSIKVEWQAAPDGKRQAALDDEWRVRNGEREAAPDDKRQVSARPATPPLARDLDLDLDRPPLALHSRGDAVAGEVEAALDGGEAKGGVEKEEESFARGGRRRG